MTTTAERIRESNRGKSIAAPSSASRVRALENEDVNLVWLDDITAIVDRYYLLNLVGSHWHRLDDPCCHGYSVASLLTEIKRNSEKPGAGRENVQVELETTDSHHHVESVPGPNPEKPATVPISILPHELTIQEMNAEIVAGDFSSSGMLVNSWP